MNCTKILVAFDGSQTSKKAVERAKIIARNDESIEVIVVTAWDLPNTPYDSFTYHDLLEKYKESGFERKKEVEQLLEDLSNKVDVQVLRGHAANSILRFAKENKIDLIIIGNRGLGGIQRFFLGSVSFQVVQKADCDVLVVKNDSEE
ncbi:universal stress protein [Bacillus shivajii]|uniref:universal stress protein n=1 Tax=Bacillus shivajii TaxID=1983719 RepID=UPI001CF930CE|nr:universal stress protein [Bacillus shivajii]UCZ55046.1 universal stress protein [Bacillus shivajii]